MSNNIADIDKNLKVETTTIREGIVFKNVLEEQFSIHGITYDGERFRRLPHTVAENTSSAVRSLATNTAGGRVRFVTDSPYVAIKAKMFTKTFFPHMTLAGVAGFDMYVRENGTDIIAKTFLPPNTIKDGYESVHDFSGERRERLITINFPLYNSVSELYVGLQQGSVLKKAPDYTYTKPIVYYGSSITQGGCASRPGMCYPAIISRKYDIDYINLGFSGSGKAESTMAEYVAGLEMSAFIFDYDHNAPSNDYYANTHEPFFKTVRAANPELPIVIMTRPKHKNLLQSFELGRIEIAERTYKNAIAEGDKNVYFIPGFELMELAGEEGCVDLCHPTDLGFFSMAKRLSKELDKIF